MSPTKIVLLGASGFLGSSLKDYLEEHNDFELITPTRKHLISSSPEDLTSAVVKITRSFQAGTVINCVAETSLVTCERDSLGSRSVNTILPIRLSKELPDNVHLIHFSTDAVFSGNSAPYKVVDDPEPKSAYGIQKAAADKEMLSMRQNLSVIRSSFFGPSRNGRPGLFNFFLDNLKAGNEVGGYSDYINNMVSTRVMGMVVERTVSTGRQGLLHIGSRESFSKYQFGQLVAEVFRLPKNLVRSTISPHDSLAFGGTNLTLDASSSWAKLELSPPGVVAQLEELRLTT